MTMMTVTLVIVTIITINNGEKCDDHYSHHDDNGHDDIDGA